MKRFLTVIGFMATHHTWYAIIWGFNLAMIPVCILVSGWFCYIAATINTLVCYYGYQQMKRDYERHLKRKDLGIF